MSKPLFISGARRASWVVLLHFEVRYLQAFHFVSRWCKVNSVASILYNRRILYHRGRKYNNMKKLKPLFDDGRIFRQTLEINVQTGMPARTSRSFSVTVIISVPAMPYVKFPYISCIAWNCCRAPSFASKKCTLKVEYLLSCIEARCKSQFLPFPRLVVHQDELKRYTVAACRWAWDSLP